MVMNSRSNKVVHMIVAILVTVAIYQFFTYAVSVRDMLATLRTGAVDMSPIEHAPIAERIFYAVLGSTASVIVPLVVSLAILVYSLRMRKYSERLRIGWSIIAVMNMYILCLGILFMAIR